MHHIRGANRLLRKWDEKPRWVGGWVVRDPASILRLYSLGEKEVDTGLEIAALKLRVVKAIELVVYQYRPLN